MRAMSTEPPVLTTHHAPELSWWAQRTTMLDRAAYSPRALIRRITADAPADGALLLEGAVGIKHGYADLIAAAIVGRRERRPVIVLSEVGWEPGSRRLGRALGPLHRGDEDNLPFRRVARRIIRTLDSPDTYYCVLARAELDIFPRVWGVDADRVRFTPFFHMVSEQDLRAAVDADGSVFAGGDSLRDYEPLVAAASSVDAPITIATSHLEGRDVPANVTAGRVTPEEFYAAMRRASVVVVPLATARIRTAGLLTYLNAMAMGKLVVVTDSLGVRDYVADRETGLVVPERDPQALAEALRWALDPANAAEARAMAARARDVVRRENTVSRYLEMQLEIAEDALRRRGSR
jgi:glycosyltransferase involved in cell wall biosynthesis